MKEKTKKTFFEDLYDLQEEIKNPIKTESGYDNRYQYAPLDKVLEAYKPLCLKHDFILLATILNGSQVVELRHSSGEILKGELLIPDYGTDAQKLGSFLTYARRYLIMTLLNITGEDDDDGEKTKAEDGQKSSLDGIRLNGTTYTHRIGTSKIGKPFDAYFPPKGVNAPIYWNKADLDKAMAILGDKITDEDLSNDPSLNY